MTTAHLLGPYIVASVLFKIIGGMLDLSETGGLLRCAEVTKKKEPLVAVLQRQRQTKATLLS